MRHVVKYLNVPKKYCIKFNNVRVVQDLLLMKLNCVISMCISLYIRLMRFQRRRIHNFDLIIQPYTRS